MTYLNFHVGRAAACQEGTAGGRGVQALAGIGWMAKEGSLTLESALRNRSEESAAFTTADQDGASAVTS